MHFLLPKYSVPIKIYTQTSIEPKCGEFYSINKVRVHTLSLGNVAMSTGQKSSSPFQHVSRPNALWWQKFVRFAIFGLGIHQRFWQSWYFWYLFTNKSLEDSDAKTSHPIKIQRAHLIVSCFPASFYVLVWKPLGLCVNIPIYIPQFL